MSIDHDERRVDRGGPVPEPTMPPLSAAGEGATTWFSDLVVNGLCHCGCAYRCVHPDLLDLVSGPSQPTVARREWDA